MSTTETLQDLATHTGIDLQPALNKLDHAAEVKALLDAQHQRISEVKQRATRAVLGTPAQFTKEWAACIKDLAKANLFELAGEDAHDSLHKRRDNADNEARWTALELLNGHLKDLGDQLKQLPLPTLATAETAIEANTGDQYKTLVTIADTLEQVAELPDRPRGTLALLVIVEPPQLPEARSEETYAQLADDHTADELHLIRQAVAIRGATTFKQGLLTATTHGWTINPATSKQELKQRELQVYKASSYPFGPASHRIK